MYQAEIASFLFHSYILICFRLIGLSAADVFAGSGSLDAYECQDMLFQSVELHLIELNAELFMNDQYDLVSFPIDFIRAYVAMNVNCKAELIMIKSVIPNKSTN